MPLMGTVCAGWVLVGGVAGVVAGLAVAGGLWHRQLRQKAAAGTATEGVDAAQAVRQLPLAADLLAACIAAGAGPVIAAQAVGEALGGPVGNALARGAAEVRLGGEPGGAWRRLAATPGAEALARLLERADVSGLPAAGPAARLASEARADWSRAATARARRAAVMVTAPVGLCFLPAFIAVGVLPVVIGLASGVLGGGGG
jgi:pilus assembly protein TadC